jgi:hypothetical protein
MSKFNATGKYPIVGALVGADVALFVGGFGWALRGRFGWPLRGGLGLISTLTL